MGHFWLVCDKVDLLLKYFDYIANFVDTILLYMYKLKTSLGTDLFSHSGGTASYYLNISLRKNALTSVVVTCSYVLR